MYTANENMHINMDQAAKPHQEVVARRIPLRYKAQTDIVVEDLINKTVSYTHLTLPTTPYV